jgi:NADPH:quinone reductase-like Zn-dependent oxidoreductase
VRAFQVGDRVWSYEFANPKGGFYAEFVAVSATHVGRAPQHLDMLQAGGGCVTGLTALQGIDDYLKVRSGETVLIFGASGAVGTLAVQFAKRREARVIGTGTGRDAQELVLRLGADEVLDARSPEFIDQLETLVPEKLSAILALAGSPILEEALDLVRRDGRVAWPNGIDPEPTKREGLKMIGYDAKAGRREFTALERAVETGHVHVPIDSTFLLEEAARAHERVEEGHELGRVVLRVRSEE